MPKGTEVHKPNLETMYGEMTELAWEHHKMQTDGQTDFPSLLTTLV